ncbi:MAG: TetR family transcriptional regulator C-terminal domain-containing protein [Tabrizicola sp.]|nr:TetR family transcriptional regulator C-terminal domain-containing protein [Tabrizicola sp.]
MQPARRAYRREGEESRRAALIAATQSLVAEGGPEAATVRAIADRAGVTAGLIRHYFQSKEELIRAAYRALMDGMIDIGSDAVDSVGAAPEARLAAFIGATLRPPVMQTDSLVLWAGYMHKLRNDPDLLAVHEAAYLAYRDTLESLIAALPRAATPEQLRSEAIAGNALLDGLWIEGSLLPDAFARNELITIALRSIGAILGANLLDHTDLLPDFRKPSP